ncbi:MAG: octaprenyl diphosphate synthase, partial [Gammaproteobacteria bacterium]|nr:octaprenyl diphosphate synthase [Gammaproteobacteria bacterium]
KAITDGGREHIDGIMAIIHKTGALEYTYQRAQQQAKQAHDALKVLPDSTYKDALGDLIRFSVERHS